MRRFLHAFESQVKHFDAKKFDLIRKEGGHNDSGGRSHPHGAGDDRDKL
nr:MAG TPA: hypothetical protein [Caudoviricetes sp.]